MQGSPDAAGEPFFIRSSHPSVSPRRETSFIKNTYTFQYSPDFTHAIMQYVLHRYI